MLGSAVAPGEPAADAELWGWRGAFLGAAVLGFAVAALLLMLRRRPEPETPAPARQGADTAAPAGGCCCRRAILLNLVFFVLLAMISGGITTIPWSRSARSTARRWRPPTRR